MFGINIWVIVSAIAILSLTGAGLYFKGVSDGKDKERLVWQNKQSESALSDVDIERKQNEVRNKPISGVGFNSLLRKGRFGQP